MKRPKFCLPESKRLILIGAGSVLVLLNFPNAYAALLIVGIWLIHLAADHTTRLQVMSLLSLCALTWSAQQGILFLFPKQGSSGWLFAIGISAVYLGVWKVLLTLFARVPGRWAHLLVLPIVLSMIQLATGKPNESLGIAALQILAWLSIRNCWFLATAVSQNPVGQSPRIMDALNPFWNFSPVPFSHEWQEDESERTNAMLSGVKLLVYTLLIQIVLGWLRSHSREDLLIRHIYSFIYQSGDSPSRSEPLLNTMGTESLSWVQHWLICLGGFAVHMFSVAGLTGLFVGVARLCGISTFRYVYKPFASQSFYMTLTRSNFHYVELITKLVMNPLLGHLRWIKRPELRLSIDVLISVFIFGVIYHLLRYPGLILKQSLSQVWHQEAGYTIYYALLSGLSAVSVYCSVAWPRSLSTGWKFALKNVGYYVVYAVVFALIGTDYFYAPSSAHVSFVLRLFGH